MDKTKKWRKILAMMLTIVMMLQNVQSVVWATGTDSSTQETTVEKKSDSEDDKTATDEEQTKEETSDKSSEELTDSEEKNTEETAAVLTSKASQSVMADTVGDVISYYANYRLDVTNTGNAAAEGVKVEITLPVKDAAVDLYNRLYRKCHRQWIQSIDLGQSECCRQWNRNIYVQHSDSGRCNESE